MNTLESDDLERILTSEDELEPMIGFSTRVMRAVHEDAAAPPPLVFPWARFLPGFLLSTALLLGAVVWILLTQTPSASPQSLPTDWWLDPQTRGLVSAALMVLGSSALAWVTLRWAAPRHTADF